MIHLRGHSALITGSTKGVGRSIALAFAEAGANVVLHGRSTGKDADEALAACRAFGVRTDYVTGDLAAPTMETTEDVFSQAVAAMPEIDILVNNAGNYNDVSFLEMDYERFERTF